MRMARAPLLQLSGISLTFGGRPLFEDLGVIVQPGDRLALVGRNGSGKSTLLKIMAGLVEPDRGERVVGPGVAIGYMEQHPDMSGFETLGEFAARGLEPGQEYRVEMAAEGLGFDPDRRVVTASGGERRRAALAGLLARAPELMLLDEPTNHLDIEAITWLERRLAAIRGAFVIISHDRAFLRALSRATLWLDRGRLRRRDKGFDGFEAWRDRIREQEDIAAHKLERRIRAEARWAVEGISARRRRNQGRLRALAKLREERRAMLARQGRAGMALEAGPKSGRMVIEARGICKSFEGRELLRDFSVRILRGDRVALVGPNGVGKTTLLKILTGQMVPDSGTVRLGTKLQMAVFDQNRSGLDENASLWENLTGDPGMRVAGASDRIMVRGRARHVAGYLRDFLFTDEQLRSPVRALSGGEKSRLLLARLMARESNLLVLDEPTNDLDIETLDLLQELLADYDGTALIVSHDRDFLDRVATLTVAMEGAGRVQVFPGGWSDWQALRAGSAEPVRKDISGKTGRERAKRDKPKPKTTGLTFTERHRLEALPGIIERLEQEVAKLGEALSDAGLFAREPEKFKRISDALAERQAALEAAEAEWLALEERAEGG